MLPKEVAPCCRNCRSIAVRVVNIGLMKMDTRKTICRRYPPVGNVWSEITDPDHDYCEEHMPG